MLELEEAQSRVLAQVAPLGTETIPLSAASARFLGMAVLAGCDLPPFDNSAMDGYAVRAVDVENASLSSPVALRLIGRVPAGEMFRGEVTRGTCVRIFTGSPLPDGADAVVMQEDTRAEHGGTDQIGLVEPVRAWENVRLTGEDAKRGLQLAEPGRRLTAGLTGLFAATGVAEVCVGKQPVVGLLATGSELVAGGAPSGSGKIYESNRVSLAALTEAVGGIPRVLPLVEDTLAATREAIEGALDQCDVLVTTGGVSVGEHDWVKAAFEQLGGKLDFWKVAIKPGKPFAFGQLKEKLFFGLPGNPVSAFVTFLLLVRPALIRIQGGTDWELPRVTGTMGEALSNHGDRRHFVRVRLDGEGRIWSSGVQASHMLHSLAQANGLVDVPPNSTLGYGELVRVLTWDQ